MAPPHLALFRLSRLGAPAVTVRAGRHDLPGDPIVHEC